MKTPISLLILLVSILGTQPLLAQIADTVSFKVMNVPAKQGKVLLTTGNRKHYGITDASDSIVEIKLNDLPYGTYKVHLFHDANGNYQLDKGADNTPIEHCAIQEIDVTADNRSFTIELVDVQKIKTKAKQPF